MGNCFLSEKGFFVVTVLVFGIGPIRYNYFLYLNFVL